MKKLNAFPLLSVTAIILFAISVVAHAEELRFARAYSNNMVLQRDKPVLVKGFATPGANVTVSFAGQTKKATADSKGVWTATLDAVQASTEGRVLGVASEGEKAEIKDVVVGDVFLFARQTSVDISLGRDDTGQKVAESTKLNSQIRVMSITTIPSKEPLNDLSPKATKGWFPLSKTNAGAMSGAAYHFAVELSRDVKVPIGIIDLNLGYHFPMAWMSRDALLQTGKVFGMDKTPVENMVEWRTLDAFEHESGKAEAELDKNYESAVSLAKKRGFPVPEKPALRPHPLNDPRYPAAGYNAVLEPLRGLALKSILLQLGNDYTYMLYEQLVRDGKSTDRGMMGRAYKDTYDLRKWGIYIEPYTVPRLPVQWRKTFGDMTLPIGIIVPPGSDLTTMGIHHCEMRELQRRTVEKETGLGLILPGTRHIPFSAQPADEALLGTRCLQWVEGAVYQDQAVAPSGPMFERCSANYATAQIFFKQGTADGLQAAPGALDCFEVAGVDAEYVPAKAAIDGSTIRLTTDKLNRIVYVRYNWSGKPDQGLTNSAGLPAFPFRTDDHAYPKTIQTEETDLPEEYTTPAKLWQSGDVTIVNGSLDPSINESNGRCLGATGLRVGFFGPNLVAIYALKGSPAYGKILPGDLIYDVNGTLFGDEPLKDVSAAITFAETEAGQGKITFGLRRNGKNMTVELKLEVLGTYSSTAPYDCPKTDRIVSNAEAFLAERGGVMPKKHTVFNCTDALFLLAAGTPAYQGLVRRYVYDQVSKWDPTMPYDPYSKSQPSIWASAYEALLVGEYYLSTGDKSVLPFLKYKCHHLAMTQIKIETTATPWPAGLLGKEGGWRHNLYGNQGYHPMPALGIPAVLGFKFAKEAGVAIDEAAYERGVGLIVRGGGRVGNVGYGSFPIPVTTPRPIDPVLQATGMMPTHNGAIGAGALLFDVLGDRTAAHMCSSVSIYGFNNTHIGHGGNFFNNWFTPLGARVQSKKAFQMFMKGNRWYQELQRMYTHGHFQGSAGMGCGQYLALVAPRQRLRMLGAPQSVFAANPPESLRPALNAYYARDYKTCAEIVSALMGTGTLIGDSLAKAEQLSDTVELLQKSISLDLEKLERLVADGKLYEASLDLPQLKGVASPGNARVLALEKLLADPSKKEAIAQDEARYKAYIASLSYDLLIPEIKEETAEPWQRLTTQSIYATAFRSMDDKVPEEDATKWKRKIVESQAQAPKGWTQNDFDDSSWEETTLPISWHLNHAVLLRAPFEIKDKTKVKALRIDKWTFRQQNMFMYINGVLVAKVNNARAESKRIIPLTPAAVAALRNGRNTIAVTFKNNWRWGRYTRAIELPTDSSVYNNGVTVLLEMQEKSVDK